MMDQEAIVARVEGDQAYIEVGGTGAGCGRCHEAGGCQSSILTQLFSARPRQFLITNAIGAVPGEHVIVRVAGGATWRAALLIYALPSLFLLLGAAIGIAAGGGSNVDSAAALGALLGFAVGIQSGSMLRRLPIAKVENPILVRRSSSFCITKEVRQ